MYRRFLRCSLSCLAIIFIFITNRTGINAAEVNSNPLMFKNVFVENIHVEEGSADVSSILVLKREDQQGIEFQSNDDIEKQVEIVHSFNIDDDYSSIGEFNLMITNKSSVDNVNMELAIFNYDSSTYEILANKILSSDYKTMKLPLDIVDNINDYINTNGIKVKVRYTNNDNFNISLDYIAVDYTYSASHMNDNYYEYDMNDLTVEQGNISTNEVSALNNRDSKCLEVSSVSNKIAWNATTNIKQEKNNIHTLSIKYYGNYSRECNDTWLSLWNYTTKSWQVIRNFESNNNDKNIQWTTSDIDDIENYISDFGDIKVRLYNSASSSFTRCSDYLTVTIYYSSYDTVKHYASDDISSDYGTMTGNIEDTVLCDNHNLTLVSASGNKLAWKCNTQISVDRDYIKTLTIATRIKSDAKDIRNQYFALWDFVDSKWTVYSTQSGNTEFEEINICIEDPLIIKRVVSDTGVVKARLYNSSPISFNRETDVISFNIEYGEVGSFQFAQLTDVHELIGSDNFISIINELNTDIKPDFTIITGDITDHGTNEQYDKYLEDASLIDSPVYVTTGNHDVRWWNANGKKDWETKIGELYYSFDYKGVHFLMLDSSCNFELDGKYNKKQVEWVLNDLQNVSKDTPILIFAHHPFKIHHNITGIDELLSKIEDYNVVAYMCGHLHYYGRKNDNYIPVSYVTYIKDNAEQDYCTIDITPNYLYMYKRKASDGSKKLWFKLPMVNKRKPQVDIVTASAKTNGNVEVEVNVPKAPDGIKDVKVRIDNYGPWTLLTRNGSKFCGEIDIQDYNPEIPYGKHFLVVYVTDNNGKVWKEYKDYQWAGGNVSTRWIFETEDMIQSTPTYHNGVVYVGSEDGSIYAINDEDGTLKWKYNTGETIISKPAMYEGINSNIVMVGSSDKKLYALDSDTGNVQWFYETEGSVLSDPLVYGNNVCFGSGDGYIYCVDITNGTLKWRYKTNGLMRQRPIVHNDTLYAFVRDTYIWYAINITDGTLKWRGNANTDESLFVCGDVRPIISDNNKLWCIDAQNTRPGYLNMDTGELEWVSTSIEKVSSRGMCTDGETVFYTSGNGRQIHAINTANQSINWYTDLRANSSDSDFQPFQIDSGLVYDNDSLVIHAAERGRITGINATTGNIEFVYDSVGYPERVLWSTPEVVDKKVYVSGTDGKVYSIQY